MEDGYRLPLTRWDVHSDSKAIVLALHGLNDYRSGFESTGAYLADNGITVIAYDQRGFGESDDHGLWHGGERMTADLGTMVALLRSKHPDQPIYLLGESMGGAVLLAALNNEAIRTDGLILVAPAVWSRDSMPFYQRWALWLAVHTMPDRKLTGEGLDLHPSDNIEMLRALGKDPLVIKATRVDVLYGMSNLMDMAVGAVDKLNGRILVLYGKHDDIIPREPTCEWLQSLPTDNGHLRQSVIYENGYHMLTRDLQGDVVLGDIVEWINGKDEMVINPEDGISLEIFCE
jgi:alpha-beta hydrolase superfamily lysophospholipase